MKNNLKKIFIFIFMMIISIVLVGCNKTEVNKTTTTKKKDIYTGDGSIIYLHYYRFQGDYNTWTVWGWNDGQEGHSFDFEDDSGDLSYGGKVAKIYTTADCKKVGFIVRRGDWAEKDCDIDRFIEVVDGFGVDNPMHIYVLEGQEEFGYSLETAPKKTKRFKTAYWNSDNTIYVSATNEMNSSTFHLFADDTEVQISRANINGLSGTLTISQNVDYNKSYILKGTFDEEVQIEVTFDGVFGTESFGLAFNYDGELGAIVSESSTTFRVWAPTSSNLVLNIYDNGTTLADSTTAHPGTDTPVETHQMTKVAKGTWEYTASSNLHGSYYTYTVTNSSGTHEVVDPYAKGCGLNGQRGLVVDFSKVNPSGWEYGKRGDMSLSYVDQIQF